MNPATIGKLDNMIGKWRRNRIAIPRDVNSHRPRRVLDLSLIVGIVCCCGCNPSGQNLGGQNLGGQNLGGQNSNSSATQPESDGFNDNGGDSTGKSNRELPASSTLQNKIILPPIPTDRPASGMAALDEGRRIVKHLVEVFPNSLQALNLRAEYELKFGDPEQSRQIWEQVLARDPTAGFALDGLGEVATLQGDLQRAVEFYRRAAIAEPENSERQLALGLSLLEAANLEESKSVLTRLVDKQDDYAAAHVELACVLLQLDEVQAAQRHLEKALQLAPNQRSVHLGLAKVYAKSGNREKARRHFDEHRRLQALFDEGREKGRRDYDDAQHNLREISQLYTDAARVYLAEKQIAASEKLLRRASELDPVNIDCRQTLSWLAAQDGDTEQAIRWLEEIAQLYPTQFIVVRDMVQLEVKAGRTAQAESRLARFLQENPNHVDASIGLAQLYLSLAPDAAKAVELLKNVVRIQPTAEAYALLASAYEAAGNWADSVQALDQAIGIEPANARFRQAQAIIRTRMMNPEATSARP